MNRRILESFIKEIVLLEFSAAESQKRIDDLTQCYVDMHSPDTIDYAVSKSAQRVKDFRNQWRDKSPPRIASVPPSAKMVRENRIKKIYKTMINSMVLEQTTAPTDPTAETATTAPATAATATTAAPGTPAQAAAPTPAIAAPGAIPGMGSTDAALSPDVGSPQLGGAMPLAGSPPAAGGDLGAAPEMPGGEMGGAEAPAPPQEEKGGDPISGMVDNAMELVEKTKDVPTLLKAMKADIQNKFEKPEHALGIVKALYDTGDPTLMSVAARLFQFIKATR